MSPTSFAKTFHEEISCLATNIYWEARNQTVSGMIAVGMVTRNRVIRKTFPDTYCDVVYEAKMSKWWKEHHNKDIPGLNMHNHNAADISFTYYLSSDETSDKFCAHTQFNNNEVSESLFEIGKLNLIKKFNNYNCNKYTITPKEGTVIIFPSSLLHSTLKKENIGDRYTIPGDIKLSLKPEYNLYHQSIPHPSQWLEL